MDRYTSKVWTEVFRAIVHLKHLRKAIQLESPQRLLSEVHAVVIFTMVTTHSWGNDHHIIPVAD